MPKQTSQKKHSPKDFIYALEDYIEQLIEDTDINFKSLESFQVVCTLNGIVDYDYDASEAYPIKRETFKRELLLKGWYYILCYGTRAEQKWQKATRNKKLYNRISALIWNLIEEDF